MAKKRKATKGRAKRNAKAKDLTAQGNVTGGSPVAGLVAQAMKDATKADVMAGMMQLQHEVLTTTVQNIRA